MKNWILCAVIMGALVNCGSTSTTASKQVNLNFGQSETLKVQNGSIKVAALSGYCLDSSLNSNSRSSHTILMTGCSRIKSNFTGLRQSFEPAVITTQVSKEKSNFSGPEFIEAAKNYVDTGEFTNGFEVQSLQTYQDAVISEVIFQKGTLFDGLDRRGWLVLQNISGHLVLHRVFRSEKSTLKQSETLKVARRLVEKMQNLNG